MSASVPESPQTMSKVGLLVLNSKNVQKLKELLTDAANAISSKLYIRLNPDQPRTDDLIGTIYLNSSSFCPKLDVRILLKPEIPRDAQLIGDEKPEKLVIEEKKYKKVVVGGTFDRLHNGHKVLLSKAAEIASEKVVVGVTEKQMIIKKTLFELIEPVEFRMRNVADFVEDVENVKCVTEPIIDPFGPSTRMEDLEAIVVSRETMKGADAVNKKREEKGMEKLDVIIVELVKGNDIVLEETKISSSSRRREDLGKLLKPARNIEKKSNEPYVIGLTGQIASGKSSIAKYILEKYNYEVIDCDKLAHTCYEPGSVLITKIAETFGAETVENGVVNRKKLGSIVFNDKEKLNQLNQLVWPVVKEKAYELIQKSKSNVVFIEAALLIEAGWDESVNEVWSVFVPLDETIKRVIKRDNIDEEAANARVSAQLSNKQRIDKSNVVFCSLWEYKETRSQVDRAISDLLKRI